jgi:hypothetical protein
LVLWGANAEVVTGIFDVMEIWRGMAHHVHIGD